MISLPGWGVTADLLLALYPTFIIWKIRISPLLKTVICSLMGLGVFTAACSLAKTILYKKMTGSQDYFCKLDFMSFLAELTYTL